MPKRIQRRRVKGWRMPEGAIYCGRPTRWANPFSIGLGGTIIYREGVNSAFMDQFMHLGLISTRMTTRALLVSLYRAWVDSPHRDELRAAIREELAGHDLACWCGLTDPCHVDILLEIANR